MKIAYMGSDIFYPCLEMLMRSGHEIIALFTRKEGDNDYDTLYTRYLAEKMSIPAQRAKVTLQNIETLKSLGCEVIVSAGYPYKIPPWQANGIQYGVNIHPSLLPQGGGPVPLPYIIIKELKKSGVTLHKLSEDWDAGDILLQRTFALHGKENIEDLLSKSRELAVKLLWNFLESPAHYWANAAPQRPSDIDYWPMPDAQSFAVDWNMDLKTIEKYLRVYRFTYPDGGTEFFSHISSWEEEHFYKPGTVVDCKDKERLMAAAGGLVRFQVELKASPISSFSMKLDES